MTTLSSPVQTDPNPMELLNQLFAAATHEASAVMCQWTNGRVSLTFDRICEVPIEEACTAMGVADELLVMVALSFQGDVGGEMILTYEPESARKFVALLIGEQTKTADDWSELEISALCETGNILGCAYLNALTRLIGQALVPSPPFFMMDYAAGVLQQALVTQAVSEDRILLCRTGFQMEDKALNWGVLFIPNPELKKHLRSALHTT